MSFLNSMNHMHILLIKSTKLFITLTLFSGPFCGSTMPPTIQSKGNRLVIRFQTDLMTEGKGFRAYWTTDPSLPAPTEPPVLPKPWNNVTIGAVLIHSCTFDCNVNSDYFFKIAICSGCWSVFFSSHKMARAEQREWIWISSYSSLWLRKACSSSVKVKFREFSV